MKKVFILNEKPSQARNFAKALGGMTGTVDGVEYVIGHALGHLYELKDPHEMVPAGKAELYKSWAVENLPWDEADFDWQYRQRSGVSDVVKDIKAKGSQCDEIWIATDVDPSGEGGLLAYEALSHAGLTRKPTYRLRFEDEAPASIKKAVASRERIDFDDWDELRKASLRSHWDLIGGMQWTRMASELAGQRTVLRNGRLKSAMVKLVGDQLKAHEEYVRKPFFQNRFKDENGVVYVNPEEPTFDEASQVPNTYGPSDVVEDSRQMKRTAPPKLIDLATLSSRLAPKGIDSKTVLAVYQKLYEAQYVSYPRTEDKAVTSEQFKQLLPLTDRIAAVVGVDASKLTHRTERKTHVKEGMAHGANRPGLSVPSSLSDLDSRFGRGAGLIYETLAKSWLATLAEDYEYEQQKGHVKDAPKFVGTANVPKSMGWKAIDAEAAADDGIEESKGLGRRAEPFVYEGANPRPQAPTMKWLMAQLAKHDIGTGATRTSTYADVTNQKAKYPLLKDSKGKISFADCGRMGYLMLPGTHIADLEMTKRVQGQMEQVARGERTEAECLHEIQQMVRDDIEAMRANGEAMRRELGLSAKGAGSVAKVKGTWNGREVEYRGAAFGHTFTADERAALERGEYIEFDDAVSKKGRTFKARGRLVEDPKYGVGFALEFDDSDKVVGIYTGKGKHHGKEVRFKKAFVDHEFTPEEVERLLAGEFIEFPAVSKKTGNPYTARGRLKDDRTYGFGFRLEFDDKPKR